MPDESRRLKQDLGLWGAGAIVVGSIIGSGIFLVPATMIQRVGSPDMLFLVWIAGGLLSLAGALSFAELSAALPRAGGEYVFLREAYGPFWGFIYSWTTMWVAKSGSIATLATGFVYYLANFAPALDNPLWVIHAPIGPRGGPLEITFGQLLAMAMILSLALVNYFGVKFGGGVQVAFTVAKVAAVACLVAIGLTWSGGSASHFRESIPATGGVAGFFAAMVAALWAYDGWNNLSMVSAEVRQPQKNLPRALIFGTALVMLVYIATNLAYFHALSPAEVASSDRVAATMMNRILGPAGAAAVSVAAMISMFGALNGTILSGARVPFAAACDGLFFRPLSRVHPEHRTPSVAIFAIGAWAAALVLSGRYEQLFTYVIFAEWLLYALSTAAVLVLRRKRPELARPYRTLGYPAVPVLFILAAACLLISTLIESPRESLMGLVLIFAGLPFYFYWKNRRFV
ncbi:MAG: amino acid permease [Bryobacteraceae bacterium]|nr:amino acid permease [Bryobacteraceae bacterium]